MAHSNSAKARLTIYFTCVFGIMVVCLAVASYSVFRNQAYSELDGPLHVAAGATAISTAHELAEHQEKSDGEADLQSILEISSHSEMPETQILIREGDRNVAYKAARGQTPELSRMLNSQILSANSVKGLRVATSEIEVPKFHARYRIFAAKRTDMMFAQLNRFVGVLLVFIPLGLGFAALIGYWLAGKALAPLNELTRTIEAITSADLSARVKLKDAPGDMEWLASRFNSLLDRLEKSFHFQRQFMADASHELRTPLTVALSATQVTARDKLRTAADCDETLSLVEEQIHRLKGIVDNMLFLSQVDASSLHLERREFYLDDAISEAARSARALARAKQQTLRIGELPEAACLGDEILVKQALLILLDNAVKYTPAGGEIFISLTGDAGQWHCRVWNNGSAIPAEAQAHIFERFYRAANGSKVAGSGLGLPIARSIAETHGGRLILTESGVHGTTFELALPVLETGLGNETQAKSLAVSI